MRQTFNLSARSIQNWKWFVTISILRISFGLAKERRKLYDLFTFAMSMLASTPTVLRVPDKFREAVGNAGPEATERLIDSVAVLSAKRASQDAMRESMLRDGWPEDFTGWYLDQVLLHGPYLSLEVPKITAEQADWQEHRAIVVRDRSAARALLGTSIVILIASIFGIATGSPRYVSKGLFGIAIAVCFIGYYIVDARKGRFR